MMVTRTISAPTTLPRAGLGEILAVLTDVVVPTLAKGVIIRRPAMVALAERLALDQRAVRRVQALRDRHGAGPLLLPVPFRPYALILAPEDVQRVLQASPEPFATASDEKRAALSHFEPKQALISHGIERTERRRFNEIVLETARPVHELGEAMIVVVEEEATALLADATRRGVLDWDTFFAGWFRMVRRVVLGDGAREDHALTDMIAQLRRDANWAFFRPKRDALRRRFQARLARHIARGEPGSLAGMIARTPVNEMTAPLDQVPQWLFAFDPAAMATFRTLALLAAHPEQAARAREELEPAGGRAGLERPFLRACVLESLRLWPTTPMVLRQTTRRTRWETGVMPKRTGILIYAPFFHRDDQRLAYADRFAPEVWPDGGEGDDLALIPFSDGPAICPGQNLVLLLTTAMIAALLRGRAIRALPPVRLHAGRPLPGTLNHFALRFALSPC